MSKEDSHQVQVVINVVLRAITRLPMETPVNVLVKQSGFLSFHQMCAHSTLKLVHKILINKQPTFLFNKISELDHRIDRPRRQNFAQTMFKLSVSREGFLSQASKLFYCLPEDLQSTCSPYLFKKLSRDWVEDNIPIYM